MFKSARPSFLSSVQRQTDFSVSTSSKPAGHVHACLPVCKCLCCKSMLSYSLRFSKAEVHAEVVPNSPCSGRKNESHFSHHYFAARHLTSNASHCEIPAHCVLCEHFCCEGTLLKICPSLEEQAMHAVINTLCTNQGEQNLVGIEWSNTKWMWLARTVYIHRK